LPGPPRQLLELKISLARSVRFHPTPTAKPMSPTIQLVIEPPPIGRLNTALFTEVIFVILFLFCSAGLADLGRVDNNKRTDHQPS